jgi:hypothetical protein
MRSDFWTGRRDSAEWQRFLGNHGLSFLAAALSTGHLEPAREVRDAIVQLKLEPHDAARWHELNFVLELAAEQTGPAQDHASALLDHAQRGDDERQRERALQAIIRLTDLGHGLQPLVAAVPLIEAARDRYDLDHSEQQFAWSRLGIAAELLRIAAGRPTPREDREISVPQRIDGSEPKHYWPDWDALARLAMLDARHAMHEMQTGRGHVFFPVFELHGPPTRLALRAAHFCLVPTLTSREGTTALRQYAWLLPAAEEAFGEDHAEVGILLHHFSLLHELAGERDAMLSDARRAASILKLALGEQHPTTLAVNARLNRLDAAPL